MENNTPLISDNELRQLLNQFILMDAPNNALQMQITDMEATITMNTLPVSMAGAVLQETLLRKFRYKLLKKALFKGLIISTTAAAAGGAWLTLKRTTAESGTISSVQAVKHELKNALPEIPFPTDNNGTLFTRPVMPLTSASPLLPLTGRDFSSLPDLGFTPHAPSFIPLQKNLFEWNNTPLNTASVLDSVLQFNNIKKIVVNTDYCNLSLKGITGSNKTQIAYKIGSTSENNRKYKQKISWRVEGDQLFVNIEPEKKKNHFSFNFKELEGALLSIEMPELELLKITNHNGNIAGQNIQSAMLSLKNEYGNVSLENTQAETDLTLHNGNLAIKHIKGTLKVAVEYGNTSLSDAEGNVQSVQHSGHFSGENIIGSCSLKTEYGNVSLNTLKGNTCTIDIHNGHCAASLLQFDRAVFNLEYGNLSLSNITSPVYATLHNGNTAIENVIGETTITTEYGQQSLLNLKGNLNLKLGTGNASCQFINGNANIKGTYSNISLSTLSGDLAVSTETGNISGSAITLKNSASLKSERGNIMLQTTNDMESLSCNLNTEYGKVNIRKNATSMSKQNGGLVVNKGSINITAYTQTGNVLLE